MGYPFFWLCYHEPIIIVQYKLNWCQLFIYTCLFITANQLTNTITPITPSTTTYKPSATYKPSTTVNPSTTKPSTNYKPFVSITNLPFFYPAQSQLIDQSHLTTHQPFGTSSSSSVHPAAITPAGVQADALTVLVTVVVTLLAAVGILVVAVVAAIIFWRLQRRKSTFTSSAADVGFTVENELLYHEL